MSGQMAEQPGRFRFESAFFGIPHQAMAVFVERPARDHEAGRRRIAIDGCVLYGQKFQKVIINTMNIMKNISVR